MATEATRQRMRWGWLLVSAAGLAIGIMLADHIYQMRTGERVGIRVGERGAVLQEAGGGAGSKNARCDDLGSACFCDEPQTGPGTWVSTYWLDFDDTTTKECHMSGNLGNHEASPGSSRFVLEATNSTILGRIPSVTRNNSVELSNYLNVPASGGNVHLFGAEYGLSSFASTKQRIAWRIYIHHSDSATGGAWDWSASGGSCNQATKFINCPYTVWGVGSGCGQDYLTSFGGGWYNSWTNVSSCNFDQGGTGVWTSSFTNTTELNGKWVRFEWVVDNPNAEGFRLRLFQKNITDETAEYKVYDSYSSAGCSYCVDSLSLNGIQNLVPDGNWGVSFLFNHYIQGTCPGSRSYAHYTVAGWTAAQMSGYDHFADSDTDMTYRIGSEAAMECVSGEANPDYAAECG